MDFYGQPWTKVDFMDKEQFFVPIVHSVHLVLKLVI